MGTKDTAFALIAARRHTPSKLVGRENAAGAKRSISRALTPSSSCWRNMTGKYWSDGSRVFRRAAIQRWRASSSPESRLRRSEEHTAELQSLMRISYAVFRLKTE